MYRNLATDRVVKLLGQGTFGRVIEAVDVSRNERVAIKVIRALPEYREASKTEIRALERLKRDDPTNRR